MKKRLAKKVGVVVLKDFATSKGDLVLDKAVDLAEEAGVYVLGASDEVSVSLVVFGLYGKQLRKFRNELRLVA